MTDGERFKTLLESEEIKSDWLFVLTTCTDQQMMDGFVPQVTRQQIENLTDIYRSDLEKQFGFHIHCYIMERNKKTEKIFKKIEVEFKVGFKDVSQYSSVVRYFYTPNILVVGVPKDD
jgi:hypothetical protein